VNRRPTATSAFGVSKRESHDASAFYKRFTPPALSRSSDVATFRALDKLIVGDSRAMDEVPGSSVALVVTSPPYFAGKEYEESLGIDGVPATYLDYLGMLRDVFAECVRKLEPGGRLAVNVANLGRRPYRSLSADVTRILQDDLRLLVRGEIIWLKQRGSSGSCAWGSFQSPANPVLRDLTERVVVASKGRFDRAVPAGVRAERGLPSEPSMTRDDFMEYTLDVWEIPAESAKRIGHPAPFPAELPARLIELYTYRGDLVLDPFVGSGTTALAAIRSGRHFAGYDLDTSYIELAETRLAEARREMEKSLVPVPKAGDEATGRAKLGKKTFSSDFGAGLAAKEYARRLIDAAGWGDVGAAQRRPAGVEVGFTGHDSHGALWLFDVAGSLTTHRPGLQRADALWKALGKAGVLHQAGDAPLVLLAPGLPARGGAGAKALAAMTGPGKPVYTVVPMLGPDAVGALQELCRRGREAHRPVPGR
jgi:modification methylase